MQYSVEVESPSKVVRKLKVKVAADSVRKRFENGLAEAQRTARIKGFREGHVPIGMVRQMYGDDVRHQVYHQVIEEALRLAITEHQLKTVGRPRVETGHEAGHGEGDHSGHQLDENRDFTFVATVELFPEIELKSYQGLPLARDKIEVTEKDVDSVLESVRESKAELVPASGGLLLADGSGSSRPLRTGDFADVRFHGALVTEAGLVPRDDMKGERLFELGSGAVLPGFEDGITGMRAQETKTFRFVFPADFADAELAGKEAEFTVTVNEVKEKRMPALDDALAKEAGFESLEGMRESARAMVAHKKESAAERKLRSALFQALIERNPFDCPSTLVEAQARGIARDIAKDLLENGMPEADVEKTLSGEMPNIAKRAEAQVRASLLVDSISAKESITVSAEEIEMTVESLAGAMKVEVAEVRKKYEENAEMRENLVYKIREDKTVRFLLSKAKMR